MIVLQIYALSLIPAFTMFYLLPPAGGVIASALCAIAWPMLFMARLLNRGN